MKIDRRLDMNASWQNDRFESLWQDRVSRRELLRRAGLGAAGLGLASLVTSCSTGSTNQGPTSGGDSVVFTAGQTSAWNGLDPTSPLEGAIAISTLWGDRLYQLDPFAPRTEVLPQLAEALPEQIDPTTYRIGLRQGVSFHNGSPFTAGDVVFTLQRLLDPAVGAFNTQFLNFIAGVAAIDDHAVEVTLKAPTALLAERLTMDPVLSSTVVTEELALQPVGTGPYRVVSAISGQEVTLERYAEYTGDREPTYQRITITNVGDSTARISGLQSGRFKLIEDVPPSANAQLEGDERVEVGVVDGYDCSHMLFHCGKPPFDDLRARQAVCFAIDRDAITSTSFFGHAKPNWDGWLPSHPDATPPTISYRFDPDEARRLLSEAGHGTGPVPMDLLISAGNSQIDSQIPIIEQNLIDAGFQPNLLPGEHGSRIAMVQEGRYSAWLFKGDLSGAFSPALDTMLRAHFFGIVPREFMRWDGAADAEALLAEAAGSADEAGYRQALSEILELIQEQVPAPTLHSVQRITAWSSSLSGFRPIPAAGFVLDGVHG
ncbi:ABC transporter substrate-binding protein [Jiangella ureilytica]|uniref:ABC transporter substrate-binding protein n=1 Tax=Jiangella ureilytica TaxID=2530374 RepID=A0A4V2XXR8_9ACTN|nr:ABC transporter substrate-binding protein [Jiangella ureilytica]TDC53965.1 ABC transporter substrate-binding protein [Jiangella ureilytica]